MSSDDRSWMLLPRSSVRWQENFRNFLENTFAGTSRGGTALCPCARCQCMASRSQFEVQSHLLVKGFAESFIMEGESSADGVNPHLGDNEGTTPTDVGLHNEDAPADVGVDNEEAAPPDVGVDSEDGGATNLIRSLIRGAIHGEIRDTDNEEPNQHAKIFFKLLKEAEKELYPGCTDATKVSFIVELFQLKCMYGISNTALEGVLNLFSRILPKGHCIPDTMEKVQRVVQDLGLDYVKIHACENDCVLFWKENAKLDTCPTCGESRWKTPNGGAQKGDVDGGTDTTNKKRSPHKILRYFPLIPRLQRIYMTESTSSDMRWHKEGLVNDGKM